MEKGTIKIENFLKELLNCRENISSINVYCNSWARCPVILVPEAANGCPRAMAPPFMFVMSLFKPNSFFTARYCGANASLT